MLSHLVAVALAATLATPTLVAATTSTVVDDPVPLACPEVFAHGGYPSGPDPWDRDQVRQPNNPTALADYRSMGAVGVEADVQLTRDGTKAVMWHNDTTWALTGSTMSVNNMWWDTGADKLNGRTLTVGPYQGEVVYTLRQYLDAIAELGMVPLIEVKGAAKQSLLNGDAAIRDRAWSELLDPVSERIENQEIMFHTLDDELRAELVERLAAAGLSSVL